MFSSDKTTNKTISPSFISRDALEGLNSGVPTRTTATLTPTTLRNIEQAFAEIPSQLEPHQNQARFVPPVIQPSNQVLQKTGGFVSVMDSKSWQSVSRVAESHSFNLDASPKPAQTPRRNVGGRRPNRDKSISPEEEERRKVRRERNKLAAARCRKRRLDHTNELLIETDGLQEKKQGLQNEIQELRTKKEELEYILENHYCCKNKHNRAESPIEVKPVIKNDVKFSQELKPPPSMGKRPTSLPVQHAFPNVSSADMPISTPSTMNFNYESLMEGGTGLTPVSAPMVPSCSIQQRNSGSLDLASPDSNKLVSL